MNDGGRSDGAGERKKIKRAWSETARAHCFLCRCGAGSGMFTTSPSIAVPRPSEGRIENEDISYWELNEALLLSELKTPNG